MIWSEKIFQNPLKLRETYKSEKKKSKSDSLLVVLKQNLKPFVACMSTRKKHYYL